MKKTAVITLAALLGGLVSCTAAAASDTVVVSAAMSLKDGFVEIGTLAAAAAGSPPPAFNFGASGDLLAQINGGAPVDVFAPAAAKDLDGLEAAGLLQPGTRVDLAGNELVLVVPFSASAAPGGFADLVQGRLARIAIVNPKTGPAGRYAEEIFASAGIAASVRPKLVFAENVRQVLDYVARGEVDAGVVYATDAAARSLDVKVAAIAPAGSHTPVIYQIAILKASTHLEAAKAFVAAARSAAGEAILARYGFKAASAAR